MYFSGASIVLAHLIWLSYLTNYYCAICIYMFNKKKLSWFQVHQSFWHIWLPMSSRIRGPVYRWPRESRAVLPIVFCRLLPWPRDLFNWVWWCQSLQVRFCHLIKQRIKNLRIFSLFLVKSQRTIHPFNVFNNFIDFRCNAEIYI